MSKPIMRVGVNGLEGVNTKARIETAVSDLFKKLHIHASWEVHEEIVKSQTAWRETNTIVQVYSVTPEHRVKEAYAALVGFFAGINV